MATTGGFSSYDPKKARGVQTDAKTYTKLYGRRRSSGGSSSRRKDPRVFIKGDSVFINGKGYSVAPELQATFIKNKTGGRGSSAQKAIQEAAEREKQRRDEERRVLEARIKAREAELRKRNKILAAKENLTQKEVDDYNKRLQEYNRLVAGRTDKESRYRRDDLRSGRLQGFSGTGLSPGEATKRQFLIDIGNLKEVSSNLNKINNVDPLVTSFFVETRPTAKEKGDFINFLKKERFNIRTIPKEEIMRGQLLINTMERQLNEIYSTKDVSLNNIKAAKTTSDKIKNWVRRKAFKGRAATRRFVGLFALTLAIKLSGTLLGIGKMAKASPAFAVASYKATPIVVKQVYNNPVASIRGTYRFTKETSKAIVIDMGNSILAWGKLLMVEPAVALGQLGGEFVIFEATNAGFRAVGKIRSSFNSKLNPFYKKLKAGGIIIRKAPAEKFVVRGTARMLKRRVKKASIFRPWASLDDFLKGRKPGQFAKFTKNPGLVLVPETVATGAMPVAKQAQIAGRTITAVNAAKDQLTSWIRRNNVIRKPFLGLQKTFDDYTPFPKKIGTLIKKFDDGKKLTLREFGQVNLWLQKNVAPNITLLERSLYATPRPGLRISRLGIADDATATLRDIVKGNFKLFGGSKPQILVFENAKVAKFPKYLRKVELKLKKGLALTKRETDELIKWQVKTGSGKFKPIGSTIYQGGVELEVTLAPGEMIRRVKQVGKVIINGKKVTIVSAEVFKPTKIIAKQLKLAQLGKLTIDKVKKLEKLLSKKLGRKIRIETPDLKKKLVGVVRRTSGDVPVLRIRGSGIFVLRGTIRAVGRKVKRVVRVGKRAARKVTRRTIVRAGARKVSGRKIARRTTARKSVRKATPRKSVRKKAVRKTVRKTTPRKSVRKGAVRPPVRKKTPILRIPTRERGFRGRKVKSTEVYYVITKKRGKFVKLYQKPLTKKDARDYLAYSIDRNLTRSAWLVPFGKAKKVVVPPKRISGYYSKVGRKLRPYRIRYGRKKQMIDGYIEKRKYFVDTPEEKAQLRYTKRTSVKRKPVRRKIKKKVVKRKPVRRKKKK